MESPQIIDRHFFLIALINKQPRMTIGSGAAGRSKELNDSRTTDEGVKRRLDCCKSDRAEGKMIMTIKAVPFPGSYWVEPGRLLAGCYPGAQRLDETTKRLNALLDAGIRTIINLMEEYEIGWKEYEFEPYEEAIQFLAQDRGFNVKCLRIPVEDMEIPTYRAMKFILDTIDRAVEEEKPVYVHCWGGRGRTGTVVGCWLARHGRATGDEALALISELRKNDPFRFYPSPEAGVQRRLVKGWGIGQ